VMFAGRDFIESIFIVVSIFHWVIIEGTNIRMEKKGGYKAAFLNYLLIFKGRNLFLRAE
jgi:hypothetical protein